MVAFFMAYISVLSHFIFRAITYAVIFIKTSVWSSSCAKIRAKVANYYKKWLHLIKKGCIMAKNGYFFNKKGCISRLYTSRSKKNISDNEKYISAR